MNRRDFCKTAAILAAGAAAMPSQIAAFEQLFDVNSQHLGNVADLIQINDIFLGGTATASHVLTVEFMDSERLIEMIAFNGFGGVVRVANMPNVPKFSTIRDFHWKTTNQYTGMGYIGGSCRGTVTYTDSDMLVHVEEMNFMHNRLKG